MAQNSLAQDDIPKAESQQLAAGHPLPTAQSEGGWDGLAGGGDPRIRLHALKDQVWYIADQAAMTEPSLYEEVQNSINV